MPVGAPSAPVHVVVLAAGRGSRLGSVGQGTPKWLLDVGGRSLADRHLDGVARAGRAVASASVVVGHAADAIERELEARGGPASVVRNPEYAELNNWWSLLRALRVLPEGGPVAVINADLLVEPAALASFLEDCAGPGHDALIAVDLERRLTDESMKVSRSGACLERIGKVGVDAAVGEYVGMLMARGEALGALRASLESFVGSPESANEWYEGAVGRTAADGVGWYIWPMPRGDWVEIDDDDDLEAAQALTSTR